MIGRNVIKTAFERDFSRPRHSARKPGTEFAPPMSTPNWVFCATRPEDATGADSLASGFSAASVLSAGGVDATTSGIGTEATAFAGFSGSISFEAAASGGAIIDFAGTNGGGGGGIGAAAAASAAGAADVTWGSEVLVEREATVAGGGVGATASTTGGLSAVFAAVVATGETTGVGGIAAAGGDGVAGAGAATEFCAACASLAAEAVLAGAGGGTVTTAFCLAIVPVTDSKPCSSTLTREYSRSRSLFSVSTADASRLDSFWLSLATDWICCA